MTRYARSASELLILTFCCCESPWKEGERERVRAIANTTEIPSTFVVEGWRMHRGGGGGSVGGGGGIVGGAGGSHRALELEHPSAMPGAPGFHWGAMLAGHHAAAAAGMMQPPMSAGGEYVPAAAHHGPAHPAMPMDLHVHQGFPYYRLVQLRSEPPSYKQCWRNIPEKTRYSPTRMYSLGSFADHSDSLAVYARRVN